MVEKTVTLVGALLLACIMAYGVRHNLEQFNSALQQRLAVLRLVAERR